MELGDQAAIVTGASGGIGLGIASALAEHGADVALWSRTDGALEAAADRVRERGPGRTLRRAVDVTDVQQVAAAVTEVTAELGPIALLVNAAGTAGPAGPTWEVDPDDWWECVETSVRGSFLCTRAALPRMIEAGAGRIVDLVSVTGTRAFPVIGATSVAKTALIRHVENVAAALTGTGVTVFALHPGTVKTRLLESYRSSPRMASFLDGLPADSFTEPEDVGEVVVRIARGELDALSGRFVDATADLDRTLEAVETGPADSLKLRLAGA